MTEPPPTPATVPRRSDAARNRARILEAARAAFADSEADVSMAEVARRAGVGSATLYRNFPDRGALLRALYADEITAICDAAETGEGATPGARLRAWLERFSAFSADKRPIARDLLDLTRGHRSVLESGRTRVIDAGRPLLSDAQRAGEIRDDLSLDQVLELIVAIGSIPGDGAFREPILAAALDGLEAQR